MRVGERAREGEGVEEKDGEGATGRTTQAKTKLVFHIVRERGRGGRRKMEAVTKGAGEGELEGE